MLRSLGASVPPAIEDPRSADDARLLQNLYAGDFDADGVLDVGGPTVPYFMMGISLGGIHTALTAPLEPYIVAATPVVAGAGLADIFIRTKLHDVIAKLMWKASGPVVAGCPAVAEPRQDAKGRALVRLSWNDASDECKRETRMSWQAADGTCLAEPVEAPTWGAELAVAEGNRIRLDNLSNGQRQEAIAGPEGRFAIAIAADIGDLVRVRALGADGRVLSEATLTSPVEGAAKPRNTPEFRRLVQLNANILEGADAITAAERVFLDPRGGVETNILMMLAVGDRTVPYATGLALARAIGLFGRGERYVDDAPWRAWTAEAIRRGTLDNSTPQRLADGTIGPDEALAPLLNHAVGDTGFANCRVVPTSAGRSSGLCLANVGGKHEYIAQVDKNDRHPPLEGYTPSYTEYHRALIVNYFHSLGRKVVEDPCWADWQCALDRGLMAAWDKPIGSD
jgi:hypothetical protein